MISVTPVLDGNLHILTNDLTRLSETESSMYGTGIAEARIVEEATALGVRDAALIDTYGMARMHFEAIRDLRRAVARLQGIHDNLTRLRQQATRAADQ